MVALGVRADGQKALLAIRSMGGESEAAWAALLDDLVKRGLRAPELVIGDGAPGLESWRRCGPTRWSSTTWCTSTAISLLTPERLHEEKSKEYRGMTQSRDPAGDGSVPQGLHRQWRA